MTKRKKGKKQMENNQIEFTAALEAGKLLAKGEVIEIQGVPHYLAPDGTKEDLECLMECPTRNRGHELFNHLPSFIERTNKLKSDSSIIKASPERTGILKIETNLNATTSDNPQWGDWKLFCQLAFQPEWNVWAGDSLKLNQDGFIEFLQEHGDDITEPDGASLIELIQDLSASEGSECQSFSRSFDKTGRVTYKQKVTGSDGAEIPAKLAIRVPIWTEDEKYEATVLVQAKVRDAQPVFVLKVKNPEKVVLQATKDIIEKIAKETGLPVYR